MNSLGHRALFGMDIFFEKRERAADDGWTNWKFFQERESSLFAALVYFSSRIIHFREKASSHYHKTSNEQSLSSAVVYPFDAMYV